MKGSRGQVNGWALSDTICLFLRAFMSFKSVISLTLLTLSAIVDVIHCAILFVNLTTSVVVSVIHTNRNLSDFHHVDQIFSYRVDQGFTTTTTPHYCRSDASCDFFSSITLSNAPLFDCLWYDQSNDTHQQKPQ